MKHFKVVLTRGEQGYMVVECPELPGCISQGKTRKEALANIREAIGLYLETVNEHNARHMAELVDVAVPV